jgi:hypothetical protein
MTIDDEIKNFREQADRLERLKAEFPDLRRVHTRWREVLASKHTNDHPEGVEVKHACGCCNDSPLQAWFYVTRDRERVYADPPEIRIGTKNPYARYGGPDDDWYPDWEEKVREHAGESGVELLRPYKPAHVDYEEDGENDE